MKTFEALSRAIRAEGVTHCFGIMGDATLQWYASMAEAGVEMIDTRLETGAVAMAEGYAHVSGDVGLASVTSGPGLVQAGLALANAARAGVPTVVFAGDTPTTAIGGLQYLDQQRFVEACGAVFVPLRSPATAVEDVVRAFSIARARRAAVVLNAPVDVQTADFTGDLGGLAGPPPAGNVEVDPTPAAIEKLLRLIQEAEYPIVLAGRGAMLASAGPGLVELARRIGAATATTLLAKGYLADPFCLGVVGPLSSAPADEIFARADLVLAFGASLDRFTLVGSGVSPVFPNATVVSITHVPRCGPRNPLVDHEFVADVGRVTAILTELTCATEGTRKGLRGAETAAVLFDATRPDPEPCRGVIHPMRVMEALEGHLTDEHRVVVGSGHFWSWPIMYLRRPLGGRFLFAHYFGSIGLALPVGIGAAVADPSSRVVVVEGDGSLMEAVQELDTATRCRASLTVMVMNDQQLGAERFKGQLAGLPASLMRIPTPDFGVVARAFGADGAKVTSLGDLEAALSAADRAAGPFLVDTRIDPDVVCDMYRKLHFRLGNVAPHQFFPEG